MKRLEQGYRAKIVPLTVFVVISFFLVGFIWQWHTGSGQGVLMVDILWHVVWVVHTLANFALIALLLKLGYDWLSGRRSKPTVSTSICESQATLEKE